MVRSERTNRHLPSLTGVRLFAAFFVITIHTAGSWFSSPSILDGTNYGYLGLTLFFILSGYVLAYSRRASHGVREFYLARVFRIWPLHLVTLAIAAAALAMPASMISQPGRFGSVANVLLLQAWSIHPSVYWAYNGVAWSLSCEVFFYLLFPWLHRLVDRVPARGMPWLLGGLGVWFTAPVVVAHLAEHSWGQPLGFWFWFTLICPLYNLALFVLGIVLNRLVDLSRCTSRGWVATAATGVLTAGLITLIDRGSHGLAPSRDFITLLVLPFMSLLIINAAASDLRSTGFSLLRWRPVVIGGECAFGIYLTHQLLWKQLYLWGIRIPHTAMTPHQILGIYAAAVAVAGLVAHYGLVRPTERLLLRWFARRAPRPTRTTVPDTAGSAAVWAADADRPARQAA